MEPHCKPSFTLISTPWLRVQPSCGRSSQLQKPHKVFTTTWNTSTFVQKQPLNSFYQIPYRPAHRLNPCCQRTGRPLTYFHWAASSAKKLLAHTKASVPLGKQPPETHATHVPKGSPRDLTSLIAWPKNTACTSNDAEMLKFANTVVENSPS